LVVASLTVLAIPPSELSIFKMTLSPNSSTLPAKNLIVSKLASVSAEQPTKAA
jgi:hypothetical protein